MNGKSSVAGSGTTGDESISDEVELGGSKSGSVLVLGIVLTTFGPSASGSTTGTSTGGTAVACGVLTDKSSSFEQSENGSKIKTSRSNIR